jgi:hypothetical protein
MLNEFPPNLPLYFPADCFGGSSDLVGTVPHYFPADCFGGSSDLAGTTTKKTDTTTQLYRLRFGGNWLHIIFWRIVLEVAQIWREHWLHIIFRWIVLEAHNCIVQ